MVVAQPSELGTAAVNGAYSTYALTDYGIFRQARVQATSSAGAGVRNWEFFEAPFDYDPAWRPYAGVLTLSGYNQQILPAAGTASALYNLGFGGTAGFLPAVTSGNYYTFNVTEYSTPGTPANESMGVVETNYNPVGISAVMQSPGIGAVYPENSVYVTVTTSTPLSPGEYVYVRYATTINFLSSSLLTVNMVGTTGTVEIPCQPAGTTVYYYAYSSNRNAATILADVAATNERAHDMGTLSINNNGGPNFIYTVLPSIGFCGDYYVPSVCYPTINDFVTALNAGSVSCDVICHVAAGHTETAPAGGINLTQTGTAANTITFVKEGIGANPIIYAPVGTVSVTAFATTVDGIFSLNGTDYITIDAIDLIDNNTSGATMMEYGYALFKASNTNGCSNNIIKNCNITLNNSNYWTGAPVNFEFGSTGIFMRNSTRTLLTTLLAISTASGRSDDNQFYANTIIGAFNGIVAAGYNDATSPYTYFDQNNSFGISGSGNIIHNYGNTTSSSRASGIFVTYNNNITISNNDINNVADGGSGHNNTLYGIFISGQSTGNYFQTMSVTNNTVEVKLNNVSSQLTAIRTGNSSVGATSVTITGNTIQNCGYVTSGLGVFYGIDQELLANTVVINNNILQNINLNTTSSSPSYLIYNNNASPNVTVNGNELYNNTKSSLIASATGGFYGFYSNSTSATGVIYFEGNIIDGLSVVSTIGAYTIGARITSSIDQIKFINDNSISNVTGGTGITAYSTALNVNYLGAGSTVNNNYVENVVSNTTVIGINCGASNSTFSSNNESYDFEGNSVINVSSNTSSGNVIGMYVHALTSLNCSYNNVDGVTSTGTAPAVLHGLRIGGGAVSNTFNIYNNEIGNVFHNNPLTTSTPTGIYLFTNSNTVNLYNNHVYDISGGANETVIGIYSSSGSGIQNFYNNFVHRLSAPHASNTTAVNGIYVAASGNTYNIYYNTIVLGLEGAITGISLFGATGFYYGGGLLNLNNNIIYVNGNTPVGSLGMISCVRKAITGTAGTPPATTSISGTSGNNFYYLNTGINNYVYVEGVSTLTAKNGYAYAGATTSVLNNLNNDPCFNVITPGDITSYKYFMSLGGGGSRENTSYYDVPNFVGGLAFPNNLNIAAGVTDYAESHALAIPTITTDYYGNIRHGNPGYVGSGTAPDVGAYEGEFLLATPSCDLLPIELTHFKGWYNGFENELHWTTETEINSDYFEIQRSLNGADFIPIGSTNAAGNSLSILYYLFLDDAPHIGINYYRLRLVDQDATYSYSNTIAINISNDNPNVTIYPNPVANTISVAYTAVNTGLITFDLIDVTGRKIMHFEEPVVEGSNVFNYDIHHLPSATYLLQYVDPNSGVLTGINLIKY